MKKDDGFSFAETIGALAIMLILTAGVGISAYHYVEKSKVVACKTQIATIKLAVQSYYFDCGSYPTTEQGLSALYEKPILSPVPNEWAGPYVDSPRITDSWGNQFIYQSGKDVSNQKFNVISYGADGKEGGSGNEQDIYAFEK